MSSSSLVLIGVGSNLPWQDKNSAAVVEDALRSLRRFAGDVFTASSLYRTSPVDCPADSDEFINAAAAFVPRSWLTPQVLLRDLKSLERDYGRGRPSTRNAPRVLDLDVIAFGDLVIETPDLVLPHARAARRAFVLVPLNEIAPEFVWPGTSATIAELLVKLDSDEIVVPITRA